MLTVRFGVLMMLVGLGMAYNAHALDLTPADADWTGDTGNPSPNSAETITGCSCELNLAYKDDGGGGEDGSFTGSYNTTYSNTPSDPSNATIDYVTGPAISGSPLYLLVKVGNNPKWYLFDITGWNGTDDINLSGFGAGLGGAISHVSIFNGPLQVPEPSSLLLLGSGLLGVGIVARRRFRG